MYSGTVDMPEYWKLYFSMSEIGKSYEILFEDEDTDGKGETLIMSDTEYEYYTNQRFFDQIKPGDEILSVGYGIGLIVPEVIKRGANLTIIEKYQRVLDLEKNLNPELKIVMGDVNELDFDTAFGSKKFDLIFSDTSESNKRKEDFNQLVKDEGKIMFWTHLSPMRHVLPPT